MAAVADAGAPDAFVARPFAWWTLIFPWVLPRLVLRPRGRYPEVSARLASLETWRSWLTLIVILVLVIEADPTRLSSYPLVVVSETFGAALWSLIVVSVLTLVALAIALPSSGTACLRALLQPVWRIATLAGLVAALLLSGVIWYRDGLIGGAATLELAPGEEVTWGAVGGFVGGLIVQLWVVVLLMACVYQVAKHMFAVADASPLLPPIATLAVTWTLTIGGLVTERTGEIPLLFPEPLEFAPASQASTVVMWSSLVAVTLLSALQLRVAAGSWSLRNGPWR